MFFLLPPLQMDELIARLDRDDDAFITYQDVVTARKLWTKRMKALDPRWTTVREFEDEQIHRGSFVSALDPTHSFAVV